MLALSEGVARARVEVGRAAYRARAAQQLDLLRVRVRVRVRDRVRDRVRVRVRHAAHLLQVAVERGGAQLAEALRAHLVRVRVRVRDRVRRGLRLRIGL